MIGSFYGSIGRIAAVTEAAAYSASSSIIIVIVFSLIILLGLAALLIYSNWPQVKLWISRIFGQLALFLFRNKTKSISKVDIDEAIKDFGYAYDDKQDIFYSKHDAWQRKFGYSSLYDEMAAPSGMIMDCEPVFFEYAGKEWMIEHWKGQYGITTGAEIGIYIKSHNSILVGDFYDCASDEDMIDMSFTLKKNGKTMFTRADRHWWLTGFKLGEFSEPEELSMNIKLRLKDDEMAYAYAHGLMKKGYGNKDLSLHRSTVSFIYDVPKSVQPASRTPLISSVMQWKNKLLCEKYQQITQGMTLVTDKLEAVRSNAPDVYSMTGSALRSNAPFSLKNDIEGM